MFNVYEQFSNNLFNNYVLSIVKNNNSEHCGVKAGVGIVSILLYSDDIVLFSDFPDKLQTLLDCLRKWCISWNIYTNANKSNIVLFEKLDFEEQIKFLKWV